MELTFLLIIKLTQSQPLIADKIYVFFKYFTPIIAPNIEDISIITPIDKFTYPSINFLMIIFKIKIEFNNKYTCPT